MVSITLEMWPFCLVPLYLVLPLGHLMGGANDEDDEEGAEDGEGGTMESVEMQFNIRSYLEK